MRYLFMYNNSLNGVLDWKDRIKTAKSYTLICS